MNDMETELIQRSEHLSTGWLRTGITVKMDCDIPQYLIQPHPSSIIIYISVLLSHIHFYLHIV